VTVDRVPDRRELLVIGGWCLLEVLAWGLLLAAGLAVVSLLPVFLSWLIAGVRSWP
jgi:hypothetical protein